MDPVTAEAAAVAGNPVLEFMLLLGKTFGLMSLVLLAMIVIMVVFLDIWAKRHTSNKIYCIFLEQKHLFSALLKIDSGKAYLGRGDDKEEYLLNTSKQFWTWWPPGMPRAVQVPVRSHWYLRNVPEPVDPENIESSISSRSLRMISDETMLRSTWRDIRESIGATSPARRESMITLVLLLVVMAVSGFALYLIMQMQTSLTEIQQLLGL